MLISRNTNAAQVLPLWPIELRGILPDSIENLTELRTLSIGGFGMLYANISTLPVWRMPHLTNFFGDNQLFFGEIPNEITAPLRALYVSPSY
jgi:hypothetical protein